MLPQAELGEHETGVWALAASTDGRTVVTGTDEGAVAAWDLRSPRALWQARCRPMHAEGVRVGDLVCSRSCCARPGSGACHRPAEWCCARPAFVPCAL